MIGKNLRNFKTRINLFRKNKSAALKLFGKNKIDSLKLSVKNSKTKLPKSRFKRSAYGMGTSLAVFGVIFFSKPLMAFAKYLPDKMCPADAAKPSPKPRSTGVAPGPRPTPTTVQTLSGSASVLCALAASSGSFVIGALCGAVVGVSILIVQGKIKIK